MSKIACKMRNSYALNNKGELYTWGSYESGLLANDAEADIVRPNLVELQYANDRYAAEKISAGHFHAAVIANRATVAINKDLKYANNMFVKLLEWFKNIFIKYVVNVNTFIKFMLRKSESTKDAIKYEDFENSFLKPFFAYQKLNNKDIFKMSQSYKDSLSDVFGLTSKKTSFNPAEFLKLEGTNNKDLKDIFDFAQHCVNHFKKYPEDFPYFVRIVMRYQPFIVEDDIKRLFDYCYSGEYFENSANHFIDPESIAKIHQIYTDLKTSTENNKDIYHLETNNLIDIIMKRTTGLGLVFTWGVYTEGRLGYLEANEDEDLEKRFSKENSSEEIRYQRTPRLVLFPDAFIVIRKVSCGYAHTLALSDEHRVYSWGSGKYGCLGNSRAENIVTPQIVDKDYEKNNFEDITDVCAGMYFSVALENDGKVYTWGCGNNGRLGHGDENSVGYPKLIKHFVLEDIKIMDVSAGDTHCAALTSSKEIYTWGNGSFGKLGHASFDDVKLPMLIEFFKLIKIDLIKCGSYSTIAVSTDFRIFGWGKNSHGMLGIPHLTDQNIIVPTEIHLKKEEANLVVGDIGLGTMHTMFLCSNGSVYSCGNTVNGILAQPDVYDKLIFPKVIPDIKFFRTSTEDIMTNSLFSHYNSDFTLKNTRTKLANSMVFLNCSSYNTAMVTNTGDLYMCGEDSLILKDDMVVITADTIITKKDDFHNETNTPKDKKKNTIDTDEGGENNNNTWRDELVKIHSTILKDKVTYVVMSRNHVICVADKKAYSWGRNECGVLGLGSKSLKEFVSKPTLIDKITSSVKMAAVSDTHTLILTWNGEIYACGSNIYGKLGIGDISKYFMYEDNQNPCEGEPVLVKNVTFADYIDCSSNHSACIMKYDNTFTPCYMVYTWGSGYAGKLGHYDGGDAHEPKKVEDIDNKTNSLEKCFFVKVALGDEFTLALDIKGNLYGWGKKKYLGVISENEYDKGVYTTPKLLYKNKQFKYISSSNTYGLAIDIEGLIYGWGKYALEDKIVIEKGGNLSYDKFDLVACGSNHFGAVSAKVNSPYTWGSNIFFKCGQSFQNVNNIAEVKQTENFQKLPRKIDFFFDYFLKNESLMAKEKETQAKLDFGRHFKVIEEDEGIDKDKIEKRNEIQAKLLDERSEFKNVGLLIEDFKVNGKFYDTLADYFDATKSLEKSRQRDIIETENKILSVINKTKCAKNETYRSDVPKIVSQNFQLYEAFLSILHTHPCYLQTVQKKLPNKKAFIEIVKMIFGKNAINMRNKRTILMLMALWNSIFKEESQENISNTLLDTERYEDFITYDIYDLIFKISKENSQVVYDLTSELFLLFITEILDKSEFVNPNKDQDILSRYKDMGDIKKEICNKAIMIISEKMIFLFTEMNENLKNNFSYSVIWMFKRFSKLFRQSTNDKRLNIQNKQQNQQFYKLFNYFLFTPFVELLKIIKDSHEDQLSQEYIIFTKRIPEILEKIKSKGGFSQLYNLYKSNKTQIENVYFKKVCAPKSDILKQIYDIFLSLSKGEGSQSEFMLNDRNHHDIEKMNIICKQNISAYQYDFTLTALKDMIKSLCEIGNDTIIVPLTIRDLVTLQNNFIKLLADNSSSSHFNNGLDAKDCPLKIILSQLGNFKIDDLDSTSNIQNFVLNFYVKPFTFLFQIDGPKLIKCECCLLPIPHIFFSEELVQEVTQGIKWNCSYCKTENENNIVKCRNKDCKKLKSYEEIVKMKTFLKKYKIPFENEFTLLFEEVLFALPPIGEKDDIIKEIKIELNRLRTSQNSVKEKDKIQLFDDFLNNVNFKIGSIDDAVKLEAAKAALINSLYKEIDGNYNKRIKHLTYIVSLGDLITFMNGSCENAKSNYSFQQKQNLDFIHNLNKGYSNNFVRDYSSFTKIMNNKNALDKKNVLKKYLTVELINTKVIDEILFENQQQPKLTQKSYLVFERSEKGYNIKLNYREKYRKFILCGVNTHEYIIEEHFLTNNIILDMRKNARNNPTINLGDIRFNVFYLIKLLNSLETE